MQPGDFSRTALLLDAVVMAMLSSDTPSAMAALLAEDPSVVLLGGLEPKPEFLAELAANSRAQAITVGARMARAAESVLAKALPAATADRNTCRLYWDIAVLRASMPGAPAIPSSLSEADAYSFFEALHRSLSIGIHTLEPDAEDIEGWILRIVDWDEQREGISAQYAKVLAAQDDHLWKRYVDATDFYRAGDPLVQVGLAARKGRATGQEVAAAVARASGACLYANGLRAAMQAAGTAS